MQGRKAIKELDRVGPYLVIANRQLHETGGARRYTLINEAELWVDSVHSSQHAAVTVAQKYNQ